MTAIISVPLWIWLACGLALLIVGFLTGFHIKKDSDNRPARERKPKPEPLPKGWERWDI